MTNLDLFLGAQCRIYFAVNLYFKLFMIASTFSIEVYLLSYVCVDTL